MIPNWEKFQHYQDRDAPWIKLYVRLNSDDDWLSMSTALRGVLTTIWLEYARSDGQLRVGRVMELCGKSARSAHIDSLVRLGFVTVSASKPLALARSREKKVLETEKKLKPTLAHEGEKPAEQPADSPPVEGSEQVVERLIRNGVIHDLVDLDAELRGYRINGQPADRLRALL